jgi:Domain of unknown function (DUF4268)
MPSEQPTKPNLGRLEQIDISYYWKTDESEFTRWLAQADNIQLLGDSIGIDLEVVLDAGKVEELQSDLLCRDVSTQGWVLIGNQLKPTDEAYLGRLLTYAADVDASAIVWISSQFLPEHRAVFDWLNQTTQSSAKFFGLEIELWRIGNSAMAAKFNLVTTLVTTSAEPRPEASEGPLSAPSLQEVALPSFQTDRQDEETQAEGVLPSTAFEDPFENTSADLLLAEPVIELVAEAIEEPTVEPLSEIEQQNLDFWIGLCDRLEQRGSIVKPSEPVTGNRIGFAIGRAGFRLYSAVDRSCDCVQVGLRLFDEDAQAYFGLLLQRQDLVEAEVETSLIWDNATDAPNCSIYKMLPNVDLDEKERWSDYIDWLCEGLEQFHDTFSERVKVLNATDYRKPFGDRDDLFQDSLVLPS